MAKNLLAQYIWEINELNRSEHGLTLTELNERWLRNDKLNDRKIPLIRKTWYAHRQEIFYQFGIDIECNKRTNKYYIKYKESIGQPDIQNWLLNSFAVGNMLLQGKDMKGRILYENVPSGYDYLTDLIEAMRENKIIQITYCGFWSGKKATFELKPYCLKVFKQRWYIIAGNVSYESTWIYALDRIEDLEITTKKFKLPKGFDAERFFAPYYGVSITEDDETTVRLKVYGKQVMYIRLLKIHESQEEIKTTTEYSIFEYHIKPTFEFEQELLSHGEDVEVLEPDYLRKRIEDHIVRMGRRYGLQLKEK